MAEPAPEQGTSRGNDTFPRSKALNWVAKITSASNSVSLAFIFLVMLLITADILGRVIFNVPVPGTYNVCESLMVFIVFLSMANTEAQRQNIRIRVFTSRMPASVQRTLNMLVCLAGAFFCGLVVWCAWPFAVESWSIREYITGQLSLPLYPSKFAVPVGMFLLMVQFLTDFLVIVFKSPPES